jgi:polysaccharide export outer membrane protein
MRPGASILLALLLLASGVFTLAPDARAQRLPAAGGGALPLTYVVALTDRLRVSVFQEDDLSIIARVDSQGSVNLPLVGGVKVAGLTLADAQKAVEQAYRDGRFLRNPQVTINVEEYAPREVSIHGMVRNPGRIPLPVESTMAVHDAVIKAGGFTDVARGNAVLVTRVLSNGNKQTWTVDVDSLIRGRNNADVQRSALTLEPGDIIFVEQRTF